MTMQRHDVTKFNPKIAAVCEIILFVLNILAQSKRLT